jgi:hypothetical protein
MKDFESRFWSKVSGADFTECWLWTAGLSISGGYGQFGLNGRQLQAHRVAYELLIADIPDGLQIDHLCRVRACVNPWHLEPVTLLENARRGARATKSACANGHPFDADNTYIWRVGDRTTRRCRACIRTIAQTKRRQVRAQAVID